MKRSERLRLLADKVAGLGGGVDDVKLILEAAQWQSRLESGAGFAVAPVINEALEPKVDASWMGMVAQLNMDEARGMGMALFDAAAEAESDLAMLMFMRETGIAPSKAGESVAVMRKIRSALQKREPIEAEKQEPPLLVEPPAGSKPS